MCIRDRYTRNIAAQPSGALQNLSNTTAISVPYQQAIDKAILSVSTGMTDYKSAMRQTIKDIGWAGMQVQYASGYHRRLDTAARQNIIDGACQIAQHSADEIGKALGYDAVELSAHLNSAPDHEPVQGHVFLLAEYAKMQAGMACVDVDGHHFAGFKRPIGEWNCGHFAAPFSTGIFGAQIFRPSTGGMDYVKPCRRDYRQQRGPDPLSVFADDAKNRNRYSPLERCCHCRAGRWRR